MMATSMRLSDWERRLAVRLPHFGDGTLDPVMADQAKHDDKSGEEYCAFSRSSRRDECDRHFDRCLPFPMIRDPLAVAHLDIFTGRMSDVAATRGIWTP